MEPWVTNHFILHIPWTWGSSWATNIIFCTQRYIWENVSAVFLARMSLRRRHQYFDSVHLTFVFSHICIFSSKIKGHSQQSIERINDLLEALLEPNYNEMALPIVLWLSLHRGECDWDQEIEKMNECAGICIQEVIFIIKGIFILTAATDKERNLLRTPICQIFDPSKAFNQWFGDTVMQILIVNSCCVIVELIKSAQT